MGGRLTILILGGYGTFGGRLATLLADETRLTLVIAGRSRAKAQAFCDALGAKAETVALAFDREGDVERQLREARPDIVVDASGPFQDYDDPYRVIRACLACGVNYLDLADGSDFVKGVAQFDAQAKACGLFVLSGVSSFPVLTAAVVRMLAMGMSRVDTVEGGIAPSPYAGVGLNVIRAIASYSGQPIELRDGTHHGLAESRYFTVAPPGRVPLGRIRFSLVDVPDLKVLPELWPSLKSIWIGAGPVPEILHRALNGMAEIRFHQGDLEESRRLLARSQLAYKTAANLNQMGIDMVKKLKYEQALEHYTRAQYVLPQQDKGPLQIGRAHV